MNATTVGVPSPPRAIVRGETSWSLQTALDRRGLGPVVGVDEAGRGACAGPLVVASCVLRRGDGARLPELTDSKLLTPAARDRVYERVVRRAIDYRVVVIPAAEVDLYGIHVLNLEGMRRAVAGLRTPPGYVLTDGFAVPGLPAPSLSVLKGDRAVACVAAASVLAKVTRDRIMADLHAEHPQYGFDVHKGYTTADHGAALTEYGPCEAHRWSYANVAFAAATHGLRPPRRVRLTLAALQAGAPAPADGRPDVPGVATGAGECVSVEVAVPGANAVSVRENGPSADDGLQGLRGGARST